MDRPLGPGARIADFRVAELLGSGSTGNVYGAIDLRIGRRVAVTVLHAALARHPDLGARFLREARAACRVHHEGVVEIHAFGHLLDGRAYLVMEWLTGETLRARLGRPLALGEVVEIVDQLAGALAALHASQVVHRDVKPDNVLLVGRERPRAKLLDLGVAKLLDDEADTELTHRGVVVGTAAYTSPEQAGGHAVDARSDVYSLGVLLFELLAGRRPFAGSNPALLLVAQLTATAPRVSEGVPGLPRDLDSLVGKMLAKPPEQRPTLDEVREVLARHAGSPHRLGASTADEAPTELELRFADVQARELAPARRRGWQRFYDWLTSPEDR